MNITLISGRLNEQIMKFETTRKKKSRFKIQEVGKRIQDSKIQEARQKEIKTVRFKRQEKEARQ